MAHKGQGYKLAFRRDFNLNVQTYMGGLADAYTCDILTSVVGAQLPPGGTRFVCPGSPMPSDGELEWTSAWLTVAGHTWRVRLRQSLVQQAPALLWPRGFLERGDIGIVGIWQTDNPAPRSSFDTEVELGAQLLYWDPAVFSHAPYLQFSTIAAKPY